MINKKVAEAEKETIGGPAGSIAGRGVSAVGGALKTVGTAFKKDIFKNAVLWKPKNQQIHVDHF